MGNTGSGKDGASGMGAIVVDDHPLMVSAVCTAVSSMRLFDRVESAGSLADAMRLLRQHEFQLAILDLHLGESAARDNLLAMREEFPDVPVLVFSADGSAQNISMAFECNVRGYVTKSSKPTVLRDAIEVVLRGGSYIPPEAVSVFAASAPPRHPMEAARTLRLSGRQEQVMRLLLQGMPNKVIARRLDIAEGTVKTHLNTVFRVLGVRTRVEAILRARDLGLA